MASRLVSERHHESVSESSAFLPDPLHRGAELITQVSNVDVLFSRVCLTFAETQLYVNGPAIYLKEAPFPVSILFYEP
ncbi:unnamed protein product [Danaus chrysippus]|uniref:(African queen) hypothetical protein n=1 Tax=Danaus chrysippus TaxID=151541 RepID=A0A8J2W4T9_9NEOP|nr:unnamed protein product [Danaus chrysippus]